MSINAELTLKNIHHELKCQSLLMFEMLQILRQGKYREENSRESCMKFVDGIAKAQHAQKKTNKNPT